MTNSQEVADKMRQDITSTPKKELKMHLFCIVFTNQICGNEAGTVVCLS